MLSSFLVTLAAVSLPCMLVVAADVKTLKSLVEECHFSITDYRFNLCPLFESAEALKQVITSQAVTPPTVTKSVYQLSLNGPLARSEKLPDHEQCPDGTWFCMTTINRRTEPYESEDPRILQVVPIVVDASSSSAASSEGFGIVAWLGKSDGKTHPTLLVRLTGGQYVNKPQRALFIFRCNHKSEEPTRPTYSWSWNGTHTFDWTTKHACGHAQDADTAPESPHDPNTPPSEDQDLVGTPLERHWSTKHSLTTILLCATAVMFGLGYVVIHPPQPLRRRIAPMVRRFRRSRFSSTVGESKLLRWAQEDLAGLDEEDEDEMVNGRGSSDAEDWDEEIPLKPSLKGSKIMNYGTAPRDPYEMS